MLKPQFPVPWNVVVFGDSLKRWFSLNGQLGPYSHLIGVRIRTGHLGTERGPGVHRGRAMWRGSRGGGWPSAHQRQGLQKKPTLQGVTWPSSLQNHERIDVCCLSHSACGTPSKRTDSENKHPALYGHSHQTVSPELKNLCRVSQPSFFILWLHTCLSEAT